MKSFNRKFYPVLLAGLALLLSACGFHLRNQESIAIPAESVYLDISGSGYIGREVRDQLMLTDIRLTESAEDADYIIRVNNQSYEREVLSVSPRTGKVEEYELILTVMLSVLTGDGESLASNEPLSASRDYLYDDSAVLSSGDEQELLREEMTRQIANHALLRASAVITNHQEQPATANE